MLYTPVKPLNLASIICVLWFESLVLKHKQDVVSYSQDKVPCEIGSRPFLLIAAFSKIVISGGYVKFWQMEFFLNAMNERLQYSK